MSNQLTLSAQTAKLVATPAPYGKPGGPGLYGKKGNKHSNYFEHIVQAMMRNGKSKGEASAMAWGILRRWAKGGGHVTPAVQAAAVAALAQEKAKGAAAKISASNYHELVFELTGTSAGAAKIARVPAGNTNGGTFTAQKGGTASKGKKLTPQQTAQVKTLTGKVTAITHSIHTINAAIVADRKERATALAAIAAAKAKGTTTTSGGSTAASSSSGSTTSTTAAASTPAKAASSTAAAPVSKTMTVATANTLLKTSNAKLKADTGKLHTLQKQRTALLAQIKKIRGK